MTLRTPDVINALKVIRKYFVLWENGILPEAFIRKIEPSAGFRNVLVHMYAKVEVDRLYENLQNGVENMELFIEYIARFLAEKVD